MSYSQPQKTFSNRFHTKPRRANRTAEDEALVNHVHASIYPFHSQPVNTCFPHQPPSRKLKTFARGTFSTDTLSGSGWGWVGIAPCASNNPPSGKCAFTNSVAVTNDAFGGAVAFSNINSPFASSEYNAAGIQSRHLSCGLRVRNITPMLSRAGTLYALKSPNDTNLTALGFNSLIADLDVTGNAWRCDTSGGKWSYLAWCPTDRDQMEFYTSDSPLSQDGSNIMNRNLAFVAQAPSTAVQTYEFECVFHFEVVGVASTGDVLHSLTRGQSHPRVEKVNSIVNDLHRRPQIMENESSSALSSFISDISATGNDIKSIVDASCDIASKTAAILPQVYAATRALGSFL